MVKSCSHRHARFPTVVNWAGLVEQGRCSKGHQANRQNVNTANGSLYSDSLVVCEAQRGEVGIFLGKVCQPVNDSGQLWVKEQMVSALRVS